MNASLLAPDQEWAAGPVWGPDLIELEGVVTVAGRQLVRIDADHRLRTSVTVDRTLSRGRILHMAVTGDDQSPGSAAAPWQTWPVALAALEPGDTLIIHDGTWTDRTSCSGLAAPCLANTPMPVANCTTSHRSGTSEAPITVIAEHPRQAWLASVGMNPAFSITGCAHWVVDAIHGSSADYDSPTDGSVFSFNDVPNFRGRNLLAVHPNRCGNNHAILVRGQTSAGAIVEDTEAYEFYRAGILVADATDVTLRRNYTHSRGQADVACSSATPYYTTRGDAGVQCYFTGSCEVDNVIAENVTLGVYGADAGQLRVFGTAVHDAWYGVIIASESTNPPVRTPAFVQDVACLDCDVGIWNRGLQLEVDRATLIGGRAQADGAYGVGASADAAGGATSTSNFRHVVAIANERAGFSITGQAAWSVSHSIAGESPIAYEPAEDPTDDQGNVRASTELSPTLVGDRDGSCIINVPPASSAFAAGENGSTIGASIVYRVVDSVDTDRKLWNQRTGAFPCGAVVPGVNDLPGASCFDAHERFRVGVRGCAIP